MTTPANWRPVPSHPGLEASDMGEAKMTIDHARRLRTIAERAMFVPPVTGSFLTEAAAEIDRLRAERDAIFEYAVGLAWVMGQDSNRPRDCITDEEAERQVREAMVALVARAEEMGNGGGA